MKVYTAVDNSAYEPTWTSAVSIQPRSRMIDWSCPDCGARGRYPAGALDVIIEGGVAYPDFLGCGAYPIKIVSRRVTESWEQYGIGQFTKFPVGVAAARDTRLSPQDAPQYFRVEIAGEIKVDIPLSGGYFTKFCTRCLTFRTEPMLIRRFAFHAGSWDGSSLFRDHRLFPRVVFCTEAVKQHYEANGFTNCRFEEMISMQDE